jgi:hypothetical protein
MRSSRQLILWTALALAVALFGCSDDDGNGSADLGAADTGFVDAGADGPTADSAASCPPYTPLKDDFSTDTTLKGCYLVETKISVHSGALLTIEPGSLLVFKKDTGLTISSDGALKAQGTAAEPILFTGEEKTRGHWDGILLHNSDSDDNILEHVTIEYGGAYKFPYGEKADLALTSSGYPVKASISNTTLQESAGYGFFFDRMSAIPSFANNTVTKNASGAGYIEDEAAAKLDGSSTYSGNDQDFVLLAVNTVEATQTWPALDVPYHVDGVLIVDKDPGITLTIGAGATLKFLPASGLEIGSFGALTAKGSAGAKITFTRADATTPWRGIQFHNSASSSNILDQVIIEHGGGYQFPYGDKANVAITSSGFPAKLTLTNSTIRNSAGYGIWVDIDASLTESGNTFSGNASSPDIFYEQ